MLICRLALALILLSFSEMAEAQDPLPAGSYQTTCRHESYGGGILTAYCRTGEYGSAESYAQLASISSCVDGSIFNQHGQLKCLAKDQSSAQGFAVWPGSYLKSCKWVSMNLGTLAASCSRGRGKYNPTTLDTKGCKWGGDIANNKGNLVC